MSPYHLFLFFFSFFDILDLNILLWEIIGVFVWHSTVLTFGVADLLFLSTPKFYFLLMVQELQKILDMAWHMFFAQVSGVGG